MGEPYQIDYPAMTGDVAQSLAELRALRLRIIKDGPKPNYSVHGESFSWQSLMDYIDRSIAVLTKELVQLQPMEMISVIR